MAYSKQMWAQVQRQQAAGVPAAQIVSELKSVHGSVYTEQQLAVLVELVPQPALIQKHRWANRLLVALLVIGAITKLALIASLLGGAPGALIGLFAIVLNVGAIVLVARHRRDGYLVSILMAAMSISSVVRMAERASAVGLAIDLLFIAVVIALGFRQMRVMFPGLTWRGQVRSG